MNILLVLIPLALMLLVVAIAAFIWAVKRGQFDDLDTPALDILREDDRPPEFLKQRLEQPRRGERNDDGASD
ncbi:MAG: cbb3-type cytochrome oxidase assembly protein CcoS [Pseudoxanthomonas suwonensis]|nr:cbb3-type cytochrome oxidase assembly protein CcoS [Pseudoxanthomonas suwonensis]